LSFLAKRRQFWAKFRHSAQIRPSPAEKRAIIGIKRHLFGAESAPLVKRSLSPPKIADLLEYGGIYVKNGPPRGPTPLRFFQPNTKLDAPSGAFLRDFEVLDACDGNFPEKEGLEVASGVIRKR
jgi:hypothetical protein